MVKRKIRRTKAQIIESILKELELMQHYQAQRTIFKLKGANK